MKRWHFLLILIVLLLCGMAAVAQAEGYTEFCTLDAHFTWLESVNVHSGPYASSPTTGDAVVAGETVFIERLVRNEYGNLWAELFTGGYLCFYDKESGKECASFISFNNGAAPVTTSQMSAPEGEIVQGTSFTFSGVLNSEDVCPIFLFDIWVAQDGVLVFDELIESWPSGVTTEIDITDYSINELYDISTLPPGEYTYMIRVWMGFTYEGHMIAFGDKYVPIQKSFTIVENPTSYTVPSGSLSTKLSYLQNIFPEGWYWNNWSEDELGDETQRTITVNGYTTTISTKPCNGHTACNSFNSGSQCCGWARMLFTLVWGKTPFDNSYMLCYLPETDDAYLLDYIKPGDIVWTGTHYMFVIAVNGDTLTVSDCNANYTCGIQWARTITKTKIHSTMKSNGKGRVLSPTAYSISSSSWEPWEVVYSGGLNIRCQPFANNTKIVGGVACGEIFQVDMDHVTTTSAGTWAWCKTSDGETGWIKIDDSSLCIPSEAEECEHANTEWVCSIQGTCTEYGVNILTCIDCGAELETQTYLGHEWGEPVVTKEPTCEGDGEKITSCVLCGAVVDTEILPPTGHAFDEWVTTREPTCTVEGEKYLTCTRCGATAYGDLIPVLDHTAGEWVVITEATATSTGLKRQSCTVCGETLEEEVIPASGDTPLAGITMSAGQNLSVVPGETVTVPVSISNPEGVSLGAVEINYELPTGVTIASVTLGDCAAGSMMVNTNPTAIVTTTNAITGSGKLFDLVLTIDDTVALPAQVTVRPSVIPTNGNTLVALSSFCITLEEDKGLPGDVNEDGTVNLVDIMQTARYVYVDSTMSINLRNADVNEDGTINLVDIMRIARIVYPA